PVDRVSLAGRVQSDLGQPFRFVELANEVNRFMPEYVVRRLTAGLERRDKTLAGAHILLVGLAYKPETGDAREAPALAIASLLAERGAHVRAADPYVLDDVHGLEGPSAHVDRVELTEDEVRSADAVVVVTPHRDFDLDLVARLGDFVLDTRRACPSGPGVEYL